MYYLIFSSSLRCKFFISWNVTTQHWFSKVVTYLVLPNKCMYISPQICASYLPTLVLLHWISHVFVATWDILISLGWTTYYDDWEVSIVQVTKRSHRMQKHLKLAVLYSWNPFIITLITKFFFYYTVTFSSTTHTCMEEALESMSLNHCVIRSHKYSCNPNILPMVSVNPTPKGT